MSSRQVTNPHALSEQQRTAIDLLAAGRNITDTASAVGVARETASRWVHQHPAFQAALNRRRQECWQELADELRSLGPKAIAVLRKRLDAGDASPEAALQVLRAIGLYGLEPPKGSTSARAIEEQNLLLEVL
jgi:hypothetical protein